MPKCSVSRRTPISRKRKEHQPDMALHSFLFGESITRGSNQSPESMTSKNITFECTFNVTDDVIDEIDVASVNQRAIFP